MESVGQRAGLQASGSLRLELELELELEELELEGLGCKPRAP